jgi:hypothetical protein
MSFIDQILEEREFEQDIAKFKPELEEMEKQLSELKEQMVKLDEIEDPMAFSRKDQSVGELFDEAQKRMNTAKWAFGLTNKLKNPEDRKKHRKNFIIVMNKLRALINRLIKKLTVEVEGDRKMPSGQPPEGNQSRVASMSNPSTLGSLRR